MNAEPTRGPWWRRARLSVRGLIILVLVIGGGLGWVVRSAQLQREAVAAIQRAGGRVKYDWEWKSRSPIHNGRPAASSGSARHQRTWWR